MKRYKPEIVNRIDSVEYMDTCEVIMKEDSDGEWVKWEDVNEEINIAYRIGSVGQISKPKTDTMECNCKEIAVKFCNNEIIMKEYFWICPAHGYKKR